MAIWIYNLSYWQNEIANGNNDKNAVKIHEKHHKIFFTHPYIHRQVHRDIHRYRDIAIVCLFRVEIFRNMNYKYTREYYIFMALDMKLLSMVNGLFGVSLGQTEKIEHEEIWRVDRIC